MKVVINRCYGGFSLSEEAHRLIALRKKWNHACDDWDNDYWYNEENKPVYDIDLSRSDPDLVSVVEELGEEANGKYTKLKIVNIPDDIHWIIEEYDGLEHIAEHHRTWS